MGGMFHPPEPPKENHYTDKLEKVQKHPELYQNRLSRKERLKDVLLTVVIIAGAILVLFGVLWGIGYLRHH